MKLGEANVCLCDRANISQLHMWPSNASGGKYIRLDWATVPPLSHPLSFPPSLRNRQDFEVTFGHYHPSSLLPPSLSSNFCSYIASPQPPTPKPPSPLKMSDNSFTLIKWDSVSVPSQATGNSRSKWNCLCVWKRVRACACMRGNVSMAVCVCMCVHWHIKSQRSRCVCMCVCLWCCDVKILPQRACRRKRGWKGRVCWEKDERHIKQNGNCLRHRIQHIWLIIWFTHCLSFCRCDTASLFQNKRKP